MQAALESGGRISKAEALALASTDLDLLLGSTAEAQGSLVATVGGDLLDMEAKVVAVLDAGRGVVDLF